MSEAADILALAVRLAREAGSIQRERYETEIEIQTKSASIDLVTEVDKACEALIVASIESERPDDAIVAEEGGGTDRDGAHWRWVIDPLDGTTNYAHGYPRFCVSIGVECDDVASVGVVYDPLLDELYRAIRGEGAFLNDRRLRVSDEARIGHALLATGFAYDVHKSVEDNLDHFARVVKSARAVRRDGSAALDLCYVAAGRFDGYWESGLHAWDVAAGGLIVAEAGGHVTNFAGEAAPRSGKQIVASNRVLHDALLALLWN